MRETLPLLITLAGIGQLSVLTASALVPLRLDWREVFTALPKLHRQMYWVYGGYVVLSIIAFALISLVNAEAMASGTLFARSVCGYIAIFWGIRICLQPVFDVREYLTTWWLRVGYHMLTILFAYFVFVYAIAAFWP